MMKLTLKETMVLDEARKQDVAYTEKKAKNAIVKVTAELQGHDASVMSQLARRFDRLKVAIERMSEKRDELKGNLKERVTDLFNAEDAILTRVVDTASFSLTLAKQSTEKTPKTVVDWEGIAKELSALIPAELEERVKEVHAAYTKINIMDPPEPGFKVTNKAAKEAAKNVSVEESIADIWDKLKKAMSKLVKSVASWSVSYDKKLAKLKAQL